MVMTGMNPSYAPEYSMGNINKLVQEYSKMLQPQYNRAFAQANQLLGGRGVSYGTPSSGRFQQIEAQRLGQVGGYGQSLLEKALGQQVEERLLQEKRMYESPLEIAKQIGRLPGATGTFAPTTGWSWTGEGTPTIAGQEVDIAKERLQIEKQLQDYASMKNVWDLFGGWEGIQKILKFMEDNGQGFWGGLTNALQD